MRRGALMLALSSAIMLIDQPLGPRAQAAPVAAGTALHAAVIALRLADPARCWRWGWHGWGWYATCPPPPDRCVKCGLSWGGRKCRRVC
jgi:hypothetical protein